MRTINPTLANPLLGTDVYKMGHMEQYKPGTTKVFSYLMGRSDKTYKELVFFGLAHYLQAYLCQRLTPEMGEEFIETRAKILGDKGTQVFKESAAKIRALCQLGYIPLEVKAIPEGTVIPAKNVIMTITNTLPAFYWCVGFFESLLLKIWDSCSTATCSYHYRKLVDEFFEKTVDAAAYYLRPYMVHDFGYRGCTSEEQAAITGAAHLLHFAGSDTVPALKFSEEYPTKEVLFHKMASVPASEHSVMCSFGREDELAAFRNMLRLYPSGIVSIVSDTYDVYRVVTEFAEALKPEILARPGKVVFRPDSGNPEYIICGDPSASPGSRENKGVLRLLEEVFGSTVNSKGYRVLNEKVGLIYGDGMYLQRYRTTLERMQAMGYAAQNLVIGVGGILRTHTRDSLGFALKATYVECNGEPVAIEKTPITDAGKKSHKGLVTLRLGHLGEFVTIDNCSWEQERASLLSPVFRDGKLLSGRT